MATMFNIYPRSVHDVYHKVKLVYSASVDAAAQEIYRACKGLGTDEEALVKSLGPVSPHDRHMIGLRYKELYNKDLDKLLKSETSGDFGYLLQLLTVPLPEAEAYILYHACKGAGTTESLLWPVLLGRTNEEMTILKQAFYAKYNKDLAVLMADELGGDFKKVIMAALQAPMVEFNASFHTAAKAEEDAEKLYKAGEGKWGTDEESFVKVLLTSPPNHLFNVNAAYHRKHGHGIQKAVEKEFGGDAKKALVHFVRLSLEPAAFLAEHFESTMKGIGTDEKGLSSALVRYHAYLPTVKSEYLKKYGKSLRDRINGETSGDYCKLLLALLDAPSTPAAHA